MTRMGLRVFAAACVAAGLTMAAGAQADCPDDAAVAAMAADILARRSSAPLDVASIEDGLCAQAKLVTLLQRQWGPPVGYKTGLTNPAVQKAFGYHQPVHGVLLSGMMLGDGAHLAADFASLPSYEADLIVVVGDAAINRARTPREVLESLAFVRPFIELPELVVADPSKMTGPVIASINVGARYGVLGEAIPVERSAAFLDALATMRVTMTGQDGAVLVEATGDAVLGHPLNAVLWLRDSGVVLEPGDMISVGSFGPLLPTRKGLTATVTYEGLPGDPAVSVTFE